VPNAGADGWVKYEYVLPYEGVYYAFLGWQCNGNINQAAFDGSYVLMASSGTNNKYSLVRFVANAMPKKDPPPLAEGEAPGAGD
jgi:hypothetical protein